MATERPVALTIDLELCKKECPPALAQRLGQKSPPSSPKKNEVHVVTPPSSPQKEAQAQKLHEAHLLAVKERAARESARIEDARLRRLRVEEASKAKIERTLEAATLKTSERKREAAAKEEEKRMRREEHKARFMANRTLQEEQRAQRGAVRAAACELAHKKRARELQASIDKSGAEFKHAITVAHDRKAEQVATAAAQREKIAEKLGAAESRREAEQTNKYGVLKEPNTSPSRVHRVLNDVHVNTGLKKRSLIAEMDKAVSKRDEIINARKEKASAHLEAVKQKAAAAAEKKADADERKKVYEKMVAAEIEREHQLKMRYAALSPDKKEKMVLVFDRKALKAPPPALLKRLAATRRTLLATAAARQAGAAARREAIRCVRMANAQLLRVRHANCTARRGVMMAVKCQHAEASAARSIAVLTKRDAARSAKVIAHKTRVAKAATKRAVDAAAAEAKGKAITAANEQASERHAFHISCRAKKGAVALQIAALKERRESAVNAATTKGEAEAKRCAAASAKRDELLAKRISKAKASAKLGPIGGLKARVQFAANPKYVEEKPIMIPMMG